MADAVHISAAVVWCHGGFFGQDRYRSPAISSLVATAPLTRFVAQRFSWVCALWLHLVLYAVVTDASLWRSSVSAPQEPVSVEIVPPRLPRPVPGPADNRMQPGASTAALPDQSPSAEPASTAEKDPGPWITATSFLASDVMNDPRSRQARAALASLTGADKTEQVCALEAMEQIRKDRTDFRPTRLAPHAFRNANRRGDTVHVAAGAVRSNRIWYEIAYRCRLDSGGRAIVGFEYALGEPIDRALWDDHGLAPVH